MAARIHQLSPALFSICLLILFFPSGVFSATFTFTNRCNYTVWPGLLSGAGTPQLSTTGFALNPSDNTAVTIPTSWSGRLWGRSLCSTDPTTGKFTCVTGDCGSGTLECNGAGAVPPTTLAEFTLNGANGLDFYDVSLVDGYNLPMLVVPQGGTTEAGNCNATGCVADLSASCPAELKVAISGAYGSESVACKSACEAFGDPIYCCTGAYATPNTCKPTNYSQFFKSACPHAYSYAYDDGSSTFTCESANYVITFCPTPAASQKSSGIQSESPAATTISGPAATTRFGPEATTISSCSNLRCNNPSLLITVTFFAVVSAVWQLLHLL